MNSSKSQSLAPIVLFVYNRPIHTERTLDALSKNVLANQSVLYVFSDGPKAAEDQEKVQQVRDVVRSQNTFKEVMLYESMENKGLANSIIQGVTKIINEHGKIIVLEDDLLTSNGFLKYMNDALEYYESNEEVMHVSGYWIPSHFNICQKENFFFQVPTCWGWGTWRNAWTNFNADAAELKKSIIKKDGSLDKFNFEIGDYKRQLEMNISMSNYTWAVKWYGSLYLMNGKCLHPGRSLVQNIGNDGTGINSAKTNCFNWKELADNVVVVEDISVELSNLAYQEMYLFFKAFFKSELKWRDKLTSKLKQVFHHFSLKH